MTPDCKVELPHLERSPDTPPLTMSLDAMLHGPCEFVQRDPHFGRVHLAYQDALQIWSDFYMQFLALADGAGAGVLLLRYEDVLKDEGKVLAAIAARVACRLDERDLRKAPLRGGMEAAAALASLVTKMQGPLATMPTEAALYASHSQREEQLLQAWRGELPLAALRAACLRLNANAMARLRYTCVDSDTAEDNGRMVVRTRAR
mmetsp:Transcript_32006/g.94277  ORF Transcript_32006/g.94277 Transcript_32006/m.94277 type:complete len:204 (+) Transcript_32006:3-614(+)